MMAQIKVKQDQTLYDIALLAYGSVEGVIWLLEDNPAVDLETEPEAGDVLSLRDDAINKEVVDYYNNKGVAPANEDKDAQNLIGGFSNAFNQEAFN